MSNLLVHTWFGTGKPNEQICDLKLKKQVIIAVSITLW
jgi:hypothetical protein